MDFAFSKDAQTLDRIYTVTFTDHDMWLVQTGLTTGDQKIIERARRHDATIQDKIAVLLVYARLLEWKVSDTAA